MSALDELNIPERATRPWCLFRCGRSPHAVALEAVAEAVEIERLVRLPHTPPRVMGLCTLRREVIPVIALGAADAAEPVGPSGRVLVLILRTRQGPWALRIAAEGTVVAEEPLDEAPGGGARGVVRRGEVSYAVIDPEVVWREAREALESWYADHWTRGATPRGVPAPVADRTRTGGAAPGQPAARQPARGRS